MNKLYSGYHKATGKTATREHMDFSRFGERTISDIGGRRCRRQHKTELGGDNWSMDYAAVTVTIHQ